MSSERDKEIVQKKEAKDACITAEKTIDFDDGRLQQYPLTYMYTVMVEITL